MTTPKPATYACGCKHYRALKPDTAWLLHLVRQGGAEVRSVLACTRYRAQSCAAAEK